MKEDDVNNRIIGAKSRGIDTRTGLLSGGVGFELLSFEGNCEKPAGD